ncbi:hypothetical protein EIP91_008254 [Steccherinum ochraceum]|uniref:Uncharacterized protein n=1 Tax=Steccherinum ochraceum TaxID=92696 RepID=A0A4R0R5U8_9APHY|nr:hypothetical protein EIP91_008254 [Steccherinum ochraceum]
MNIIERFEHRSTSTFNIHLSPPPQRVAGVPTPMRKIVKAGVSGALKSTAQKYRAQ